MTREEFIEKCKSIRHNGKGFVVNTRQREENSMCVIDIEHDELIPYVIGVFSETDSVKPAVFMRQDEFWAMKTTEYFDAAWRVLELRIINMTGKKTDIE